MVTLNTKFALCIAILFGIFSQVLDAVQSGIYIDNGIDQTIMHSTLDADEKASVSTEILDFLGLSQRPELNTTHHGTYMRKSAPKYLLDVYSRIMHEEGLSELPRRSKRSLNGGPDQEGNFITLANEKAIKDSDVIMTFSSLKHVREHAQPPLSIEQHLWFNMSGVSRESELIMASLRIYKKASATKVPSLDTVTVTVISSSELPSEQHFNLQQMAATSTTFDYVGWLEVNVTQIVQRWLQQSHDAHADAQARLGLTVKGASYVGTNTLQQFGLFEEQLDSDHQPFLVGFFKKHELVRDLQRTRKRRSISVQRAHKSKVETIHTLRDSSAEYNMRSCQMKTLYIDFNDLGWRDWIIAPEGYGAFYCSGECNFPLNAHMNATNHAIVQTLVHLLEPQKVPKPCCAPTRLGALPVLYHLNDENVNLKKYRSMIVKSCGCH